MAHPPCREVPAGNGVRGPVRHMPGHAAHEAPQGGAEVRHDAVRAGPADKGLARPVRRFGPCRFLLAGPEMGAGRGGIPAAGQGAQPPDAARGQAHRTEKGAVPAGLLLRFAGCSGRMETGKLFLARLVPPPAPPKLRGLFCVHARPPCPESGCGCRLPSGPANRRPAQAGHKARAAQLG